MCTYSVSRGQNLGEQRIFFSKRRRRRIRSRRGGEGEGVGVEVGAGAGAGAGGAGTITMLIANLNPFFFLYSCSLAEFHFDLYVPSRKAEEQK